MPQGRRGRDINRWQRKCHSFLKADRSWLTFNEVLSYVRWIIHRYDKTHHVSFNCSRGEMRKAKFLHLDSRSTGPFVQASRLRIAMCNPAISEVRGSNTCELPWARMFVGPESFPNARDQTQNLSLYIYDIYIYMPLFMWMSSKNLFTTCHNRFSLQSLGIPRAEPPNQNPPFFQWHPGAGSGGRSSLPGPKMPMAEKKWTWWS
jgi:hypothetical protein